MNSRRDQHLPARLLLGALLLGAGAQAARADGERQKPLPPVSANSKEECIAYSERMQEAIEDAERENSSCIHSIDYFSHNVRWVPAGPCCTHRSGGQVGGWCSWPERCAPLWERIHCLQEELDQNLRTCLAQVGESEERAREVIESLQESNQAYRDNLKGLADSAKSSVDANTRHADTQKGLLDALADKFRSEEDAAHRELDRLNSRPGPEAVAPELGRNQELDDLARRHEAEAQGGNGSLLDTLLLPLDVGVPEVMKLLRDEALSFVNNGLRRVVDRLDPSGSAGQLLDAADIAKSWPDFSNSEADGADRLHAFGDVLTGALTLTGQPYLMAISVPLGRIVAVPEAALRQLDAAFEIYESELSGMAGVSRGPSGDFIDYSGKKPYAAPDDFSGVVCAFITDRCPEWQQWGPQVVPWTPLEDMALDRADKTLLGEE